MCDRAYHLFREAVESRFDVSTKRGYEEFCKFAMMDPEGEYAKKLQRVIKGEAPPSRTDWAMMAGLLKRLGDQTPLAEVFNCPECQLQ